MAIATARQGVYKGYSDSNLDTNCKTILGATTVCPMVNKLQPELKDAQSFYDAYSTAVVNAKLGNKEAIAVKNAAKLALRDSMERLTIAVNYAAMGDVSLLTSTAMPLTIPKGKKVPKVITTPSDITATNVSGASGSVRLEAGITGGATSFQFQYSPVQPTANTVWESYGATEKSFIITGLPPLTIGYFRIIGIGPRKQQMISSVITCSIS